MDSSTVILQHKKICDFITQKKIKQSLDILKDMIEHVTSGNLRDEYENIVSTYRNMLRYTLEGVKDPE